jgi:hypothetical protein
MVEYVVSRSEVMIGFDCLGLNGINGRYA